MQPRLNCRIPPPPAQPPQGCSIDVGVPTFDQHATGMPPSPLLSSDAITPQNPHPSAGLRALGISYHGGVSTVAPLMPPPVVFPAPPPLPTDSTILSAHSTASGSVSRIGIRDVAELVRHLAESRCMTRQLQKRVHEMESSLLIQAEASGDSAMSALPARQDTNAAVQTTQERLATSGEGEVTTSAEQAPQLYDHSQEAPVSKRRQRTVEGRDDQSARAAVPVSTRTTEKGERVSATFRRSRLRDSSSFRTARRCTSSMTSPLASTASSSASAATSSLSHTSSPSTIAESPVRGAFFPPSSRYALNGVCSTALLRHGPHRESQEGVRHRRMHSAPERPRQRPASGHTKHRDPSAAADMRRKPKKQHRRGSADRHRTRTHSKRRRRHRTRSDDGGNTATAAGDGEGTRFTPYAAATLSPPRRYCSRSSATESRRHRRIHSAVADTVRLVSLASSLPTAAALRVPGETRGSLSREKKAVIWQRRYYDLLARYTDETTRRDADLVDIHEMIECIIWEQERSRHRRAQRHHALSLEDNVGDKGLLPLQCGAAPPGGARGFLDVTNIASASNATAAPPAVPSTPGNGIMRTKDDVSSPCGHVPASGAATPEHESLEYIEAVRCEADAWRQRSLDLLQQPQPPHQRIHGEVKLVTDVSIAALPPRPAADAAGRAPHTLGIAPTSRQAGLLSSANTTATADAEATCVPGGVESGWAGDASTLAAHLRDTGVQGGRASVSRMPSHLSTPVPRVEQVAEQSPSTTPAAVHQPCHPYAPPRLVPGLHVSSIGATSFAEPSPTQPPSSFVQEPVHPAGVAPSPPATFPRPVASSWSPSPAKPPLFVGVPGYQPLNPSYGLHAALSSGVFAAPPPSCRVLPPSTSIDSAVPATASTFAGAPLYDTGDALARGNAVRGRMDQDHGHAARGTSRWLPNATFELQHQDNLDASYFSPSVPDALMPHQRLSPPLHTSPPLSRAAELMVTREQLERDIRRHDQLLAAIGKLQRTAAEHATRRTF
ncbi:hypothetical protein JKF63_05277 [Porcisia hertigi]|uniref:Uncharacterized protein n=1 Tax=Porcisia hertigi TaxID=2761500 RepID=A0A836IG08_9TRYP|nr:hypothetical protein JKF63_05277 [Porcisia hertigi]